MGKIRLFHTRHTRINVRRKSLEIPLCMHLAPLRQRPTSDQWTSKMMERDYVPYPGPEVRVDEQMKPTALQHASRKEEVRLQTAIRHQSEHISARISGVSATVMKTSFVHLDCSIPHVWTKYGQRYTVEVRIWSSARPSFRQPFSQGDSS